MNRFKRAMLWAALIAIILLVLLSIYGAFLGAERAQAFFNSLPLAVYWFALIGLLIARGSSSFAGSCGSPPCC